MRLLHFFNAYLELVAPEITFYIQNLNAFCFICIVTGSALFSRKFIAYISKMKHIGNIYTYGAMNYDFPLIRYLQVRKTKSLLSLFLHSFGRGVGNLIFWQVRNSVSY